MPADLGLFASGTQAKIQNGVNAINAIADAGPAVFDEQGVPTSALSLTGVESRFRPDRQPALGGLLLDRAHALTKLLH